MQPAPVACSLLSAAIALHLSALGSFQLKLKFMLTSVVRRWRLLHQEMYRLSWLARDMLIRAVYALTGHTVCTLIVLRVKMAESSHKLDLAYLQALVQLDLHPAEDMYKLATQEEESKPATKPAINAQAEDR